jgi:nitrogen regulatory protein P-II 1
MSAAKVEAIIRPHTLSDARDALQAIGISGMTVTDVRGFGRQKGHTETYRGDEYSIDFLPKVKVEVVCSGKQIEKVVNAVIQACRTGKLGDGRIFVTKLDDAVRIRTGERGDDAV